MASTARQAQLDTSSVVDVTINQSSPTEMSKMRRHHDDEIAGEPQKYYFEYIYGAHEVHEKKSFPKSNLWFWVHS